MTISQQEVKAQVQAVLADMDTRWKWAACDKDGHWGAFRNEPRTNKAVTYWYDFLNYFPIKSVPPFPGDWRESLIRRV